MGADIASVTKGEIVSIDGKTARGSGDAKTKAIHMVSAWANAKQFVLGQIKTDEKWNEITAIPTLLEMLELKGCIVSYIKILPSLFAIILIMLCSKS